MKLVEEIAAELMMNTANLSSASTKDCVKAIRDMLRTFSKLIQEATIPSCFDGCFNCVLWENCSHPSPLVRPWLVSKEATKIILNHANL